MRAVPKDGLLQGAWGRFQPSARCSAPGQPRGADLFLRCRNLLYAGTHQLSKLLPPYTGTPALPRALGGLEGRGFPARSGTEGAALSLQIRGALNAVRSLVEDTECAGRDLPRAVVTHSSGNHGQALACAAQAEGNASPQLQARRAAGHRAGRVVPWVEAAPGAPFCHPWG